MMQDMGLDGAMKDMAADESEVPVNSARCTPQEGPSLGGVVRDRDIRMLKERYGDYSPSAQTRSRKGGQRTDPVVCPQIRKSIKQHHIPRSKPSDRCPKSRRSKRNPHIRNQDVSGVLRFEVRSITSEVEMAPLPPRRCCHSLDCEVVDGHVDWPGYELMEKECGEGDNWGVFHHLPRLAMGCSFIVEILFQRRHECNISIEVVC